MLISKDLQTKVKYSSEIDEAYSSELRIIQVTQSLEAIKLLYLALKLVLSIIKIISKLSCYSTYIKYSSNTFNMRVNISLILTGLMGLAMTSPSLRNARSEDISSIEMILTVNGGK